jgi:hypothetical protein
MLRTLFVIFIVVLAGCDSKPPADKTDGDTHKSHSSEHAKHENKAENAMLMVEASPPKVIAGKPTELSFMIHDAKGEMVKDFEVMHEKKIHLIIVRDGLDHFDHIHPQLFPTGKFAAGFTFPVGGLYRLYADFKPKDGPQAVAIAELRVEGETPKAPSLKVNVPGKVQGDGLDAVIAIEKPSTVGSTKVVFEITNTAGKGVDNLEPYLGAMGHLVVLTEDGKQFVHAHPDEQAANKSKSKVGFDVHFPGAGMYKAWGQFQREKKVFTIPFVIEIMK